MTRRALLVGAQTDRLTGPNGDVRTMAAALKRHGFTDVRVHIDDDASRDRIIAGYERLIADTAAGDAVLFYYAGHGSYVIPAGGERVEVATNSRQFIVPTDYVEPFGDDFRGITAVELSVLLERLTRRTENAIVVLDCCYSAMMSRTLGTQVPRQLNGPTVLDLEAHLRRRFRDDVPIDRTDPLGNQKAVRLVACGAREVAYEQRPWGSPEAYGLFTAALVRALDESAGVPVSWSSLTERIRRLVQEQEPHQRPEVEGRSERRLFETEPDRSAGSLPVVRVGDRVLLRGAALLGVQRGDRFAIKGPGGTTADLEIDRCDPEGASGLLPGVDLPAGTQAVRTYAVAPRIAVQVPADLDEAVETCTFARPVSAPEEAPFLVTQSDDGGFLLRDRFGPLMRCGPDGRRDLVESIERVARATVLREVREESELASGARVEVVWGLVDEGVRDPLPLSGARLSVGDSIFIEVRNRSGGDLWVSVLDIGVSYGITHITNRAGSGDRFADGDSYVFGLDRRTRELTGRKVSWPAGLDPVSSRPETVLLLVTTDPYDVTSLVQPPVRGAARSRGRAGLLSHFLRGTSRDFTVDDPEFDVISVEFTLSPLPGNAS
jgi:hypothetical protein